MLRPEAKCWAIPYFLVKQRLILDSYDIWIFLCILEMTEKISAGRKKVIRTGSITKVRILYVIQCDKERADVYYEEQVFYIA